MIDGDKITSVLPQIRVPIQVVGLVISFAAFILIRSLLPGALSAQISAGVLAILFVIFNQVFAYLENNPSSFRSTLHVKILILFGGLVLCLLTIIGVSVTNTLRNKQRIHDYPLAARKLIDLQRSMVVLRGKYETLAQKPSETSVVNQEARELVEKMLAIDDGDLQNGTQIFKYQMVAYCWAIAAGSESDPKTKLALAEETIGACDKGQERIAKLMQAGPYSKIIQDTRDWVTRDDAESRLQRLRAVALCIRWQVSGKPADRLQVQKIIKSLPNTYRVSEQPEQSAELKPCLSQELQNH